MNATLEPAAITRKSNEWIDAPQLRTLLKQNLGLNARQVTVSRGHSLQYLAITIRDASVDISAVEAFAKSLDTWQMDQTDYVTGQSISVRTSSEVDAIHASQMIDEIRVMIPKFDHCGQGEKLSTGAILWRGIDAHGFYVQRGQKRGQNVHDWDVMNRTEWALEALARQAARI
jgi:hypothetical protein